MIIEKLGNGIKLEMVLIPGGNFLMGSPEDETGSRDSERPQHQVTIKPFCLGKYPVTQAQWRAVAALPKINQELNFNPSYWIRSDNYAVNSITWNDAVEFCARLSALTNRLCRLPSEAEWEYACRAGTTTPFHFGESITTDLVNYEDQTFAEAKPTPVGTFPPNAFGLYDMHGNVCEWCQDDWHDNYKDAPTDGSAWINKSDKKVIRGGCWDSPLLGCRSASRWSFGQDQDDDTHWFNGLRVVFDVAEY